MSEGKEKLIADIPASTKKALSDMAFDHRLSMTKMVVQIIDEAAKKHNRKKKQ